MKIQIDSRSGHFDLMNPFQEEFSTSISIKKGGKVLMTCSIITDDRVETNDPLKLKEKIESYLNSLILTTQKDKLQEMMKFLEENQEILRKAE